MPGLTVLHRAPTSCQQAPNRRNPPVPGRFIGTDPLLAGAVLASIEKRSPPESADLTVHIWSEAGDTSRGHASAGNTPDASTANNKRI